MKIYLALFAVASLLSPAAHGFGHIGHQIIGAIADGRLAKTAAGEKIAVLLDGFTLEKAALIPDEIRGWDKTGADDPQIFHYSARPRIDAQLRDFWRANQPTQDLHSARPSHLWFHYTDVPIFPAQKYGAGQAGRSPWDIVHAMRYCIAVLKGKEPEENARKVTRPIAIILLAHFVGDTHQPLHVGAPFFNEAGALVDPRVTSPALEDQGGNTIMLRHSPAAARRIGQGESGLHRYWDTDTVNANLPVFPETMPKDERSAQMEGAQKALVAQYVADEPKNWRMPPELALTAYPEAWADEILPIAVEAHERLRFVDIRPKQDENGGVVAAGFAEEKLAPDQLPYDEWATRVVHDELHQAGWRLADLLAEALGESR